MGDNMNNKIRKIVDDIKSKGSMLNEDELISKSEKIINKDYSLRESLMGISNTVKSLTEDFLHKESSQGIALMPGISSCIFLPSINGDYKIRFIGGKTDRNFDLDVNEDTLFDVASISKLYTLLLLFKLEEMGLINLNTKISEVNSDFKNLEDFTFNDFIRLHGIPYTNGRIDSASSYEEAYEILKSTYLKSNSRQENTYTDIGAIIMGKTIEKIVSKEFGKDMSFEDIMNEFLFKPLNLEHTMYNPKNKNIASINGAVHDPKTRILGGAVGSAGIFVNSNDLASLAKNIYTLKYLNQNYVNRLGEITFPNSKQSMKGNLGIYVKHPLGLEATYTPNEMSDGSFSHQGYTGSVVNFDPNNMIHQNILVNAIYETDDKTLVKNDKPIGYASALDEYLAQITKNSILMLVVKEYYNRYCKVQEDIDEVVRVR